MRSYKEFLHSKSNKLYNSTIVDSILIFIISILIMIYPSILSSQRINYDNFILDWEDNFESENLDTTIWSLIPRGHQPWNMWMSSDSSCYEYSNGTLILKGILNTTNPNDTAKYLTGGIWSKQKKGFKAGRFEIRAKLKGISGSWPAIWLGVVNKNVPWPWYGEIDIMERFGLNHKVTQSLHTYYTLNIDKNNPQSSVAVPIDFEEYNTFGVDILEDSITFHVNGLKTLTYTRIKDSNTEGQFPFFQEWYVILDMQLRASNVTNLPDEMHIDWIRHYREKEETK